MPIDTVTYWATSLRACSMHIAAIALRSRSPTLAASISSVPGRIARNSSPP